MSKGEMKRVLGGCQCGAVRYRLDGRALGTLDDASWLVPDSHYWTKRKQTWVVLPDGVDCFVDDN